MDLTELIKVLDEQANHLKDTYTYGVSARYPDPNNSKVTEYLVIVKNREKKIVVKGVGKTVEAAVDSAAKQIERDKIN